MSTVLLIDLSSVLFPLWHTSGSDPDPDATSRKTVERVRALASGQPHVAICCDSGRSFRKDIEPSYKAQREAQPAALTHQMQLAQEILAGDGFPVWAVKGFEADDLIASAADRVGDKQCDVLIASADKDLLQLISPRVCVKRLTDGEVWDEGRVYVNLGVRPDQMVDYLALCGDASDNVKGANKVGAKTASALLTKYGNLEDLFAALHAHGSDFTPALAANLREFESRVEQVRSLIRLRTDVALPIEEVFLERVPIDFEASDLSIPAGGPPPQDRPVNRVVPNGEDSGHFSRGSHDAMGETAPSAASATPAEPAGVESAVREAARPADAPVDPMAALAASVQRPTTQTPQTTALAVREPEVLPPPSSVFEMQLEPRSLREAALLGQEMFKSRLFSAYGTPQGILSTILAGRELGLQAMASLRAFHIIDGKPTMSADLIRAMVLKSGHCEYFRCAERTPERATFITKRKNEAEISLTYTLDEAKTAGLVKAGSGWMKNPADMCVARSSSKLARLVYADVVFNMYAPEEME